MLKFLVGTLKLFYLNLTECNSKYKVRLNTIYHFLKRNCRIFIKDNY